MTSSGLRATFVAADGKTTDTKKTPTLALYVPQGESPTSFLPGGKFQVTWSGFIRADLRDEISFQAEVGGTFKLEVGGVTAIEAADTKVPTEFSKPVALKKGLNILRATFSSPITGDSFVRVRVKTSDGIVQTLDPTHLNCADTPESRRADALRDGMTLFLEHRCARCHETGVSGGTPDLYMDAPVLDGIGARLREDWMARWVADPRSIRSNAHMPKIAIASRPENARAIAAFLASTGTNAPAAQPKLSSAEMKKAQAIFENQHCDACHYTESVGTPGLNKVSLSNVASKFYPDALRAYIEKPDAFYKWTGMPRYRLPAGDSELLARWLISGSLSFAPSTSVATTQMVEHGRELVQSLGCLNCHGMKLPNKFTTMPLARGEGSHGGCIGLQPTIDFGFSTVERSEIDMWLSNQRASLSRNVPMEFAERHYARLRCAECHQKLETVPGLDQLGEKLKAEWMGRFICGEIAQKPRPWLTSQMPAFPQFGLDIGRGLAEASGFAPHATTNSVNVEVAKIGGQLVQPPQVGLGCVQCHANGAGAPTVSLDAPGINFAFVAARLQPSYFQRWVRKPAVIDPHTKMPAFFTDEGTSPLKQYFDGDADKQIGAIWEYLQTEAGR
jgi:mono/diheme cytochrome c family protein